MQVHKQDWAVLPLTTRRDTLPFLSVEDNMSLNSAMTNHEARPHLMASYRDMRSPAFDRYVYTDKEDYGALRWAMEKGVDLRGFVLERGGEKRSGAILAELIGCEGEDEKERKLDMAEYYVARGKLRDLDDAVDAQGSTILCIASNMGYVSIVQGLLSAEADKDKARNNGETPFYIAAEQGHMEVVHALLSAEADKDKACDDGATPLYIAAEKGHMEVVHALLSAGADVSSISFV